MADREAADAERGGETGQFDAVVVGAGFAGLYALYRLRAMGLCVIAFEAAAGVARSIVTLK